MVHSRRLAGGVPLGGIGCGAFDLMTDGAISQATINNNPDQPTGDLNGCFAALWTNAGGRITARALRLKSAYNLPSVAALDFLGLFPQAYVSYPDPGLPVTLSLRAYSSLIPHDVKNSSIPAALFVFTIKNDSRAPVEASIALSWENILGVGGNSAKGPFSDRNGNRVAPLTGMPGYFGLRFLGPPLGKLAPTDRLRFNAHGNYALVAEPPTRETQVTTGGWNALDSTPGWWNQFASDGTVAGTVGAGIEGSVHPAGVVALKLALKEGETQEIPIVFAWYTPNHYTLSEVEVGHLYEKSFPDAVQVARYALESRLNLAALIEDWQNRILRSSLPPWLSRKLINDCAPLFSNTVLTRDSGLGISKPGPSLFAMLESPVDGKGALDAMDHRALADYLITAWFPDLELQSLRQFADVQTSVGAIPRLSGNVDEAIVWPKETGLGSGLTDRPDVTCCYVAQVARYFRWTGDQKFLDEFYPSVKHAVQFAVTLDKDGDGIPDGASVYDPAGGPLSYSAAMWLGALRITIRLATAIDDKRFAAQCQDWFDKAQKSALAKLWNGRFLKADKETGRQGDKETKPVSLSPLLPFSPSDVCFASQLAGQWLADTVEAGDILPAERIESALDSLITLNDKASPYCPPLFVDSSGAMREDRRSWPNHAAAYQAALYARRGRADAGLDLMQKLDRTIREQAQTPWQAALQFRADTGQSEIGRRHMTAMSSWHYLAALEGFALDLPAGRLTLTPHLPSDWRNFTAPIFTPTFSATLEYRIGPGRSALTFRLDQMTPVLPTKPNPRTRAGLTLKQIVLPALPSGIGQVTASLGRAPLSGKTVRDSQGRLVFTFETPLILITGQRLEFTIR